MNNDTTRRYPRTMQEAFGPYTSNSIQEEYDPMPKEDRIVVVACLCAAAALVAMAVLGWV